MRTVRPLLEVVQRAKRADATTHVGGGGGGCVTGKRIARRDEDHARMRCNGPHGIGDRLRLLILVGDEKQVIPDQHVGNPGRDDRNVHAKPPLFEL